MLRPPAGKDLVVTTDTLVAMVHFLEDDTPQDLAAKLLGVSLSDLAAMGAEPLAYTLNLALPTEIDDRWLAAFADGLAADQARFGIDLIGGDTVSTPGMLTLGATLFGTVPTGHGARPRRGRRGRSGDGQRDHRRRRAGAAGGAGSFVGHRSRNRRGPGAALPPA